MKSLYYRFKLIKVFNSASEVVMVFALASNALWNTIKFTKLSDKSAVDNSSVPPSIFAVRSLLVL